MTDGEIRSACRVAALAFAEALAVIVIATRATERKQRARPRVTVQPCPEHAKAKTLDLLKRMGRA